MPTGIGCQPAEPGGGDMPATGPRAGPGGDVAALRARLAVAGHADHDDVFLHPLERLVAEAQPFDDASGEVLRRHVAGRDQPLGDLLPPRLAEVKGDAPLALVVL